MAERRTEVQYIMVTPEESGQKLVKFLERRFGRSVPGGRIMRAIRKGEVRVDGRRAKPFDRVYTGRKIRIPPISIPSSEESPSKSPVSDFKSPLPILRRERDVLAVDKPAGLPVHGGTGHDDSVVSRLGDMFPDAPFAPTPAHRLDRGTTGVLLVGMSYEALTRLQDAFRERSVRKHYLAWVEGVWKDKEPVRLEDRLSKNGCPGKEKIQVGNTGKIALAEVRRIKCAGASTLLAVELFTGRTHQIRVQLAERGFPLIGDIKYGGTRSPQGLLLHSRCIEIFGTQFHSLPKWGGKWFVPA